MAHTNTYTQITEIPRMLCVRTQLCPTLCDPMDYSPPCFFVHGISQARILEQVAIPYSRGSSQPRDWTRVSCIIGRFFTILATREDVSTANYIPLLENTLHFSSLNRK